MLPDIKDEKLARNAEAMQLNKEIAKAREAARVLKKKLKLHSKSNLIHIILEQTSRLQEMQQAARQLFEENKRLKGIKNETIKNNKPSNNNDTVNDNNKQES